MERRQFLAAGSLGLAGGAFGLANAARSTGATPAPPSRIARPEDANFHFGITGYDVDVDAETQDGGAPVAIDVSVDGDRIDVGESVDVRVSVTNRDDDAVSIRTGPPTPFGALGFSAVQGSGGFLAWSDEYGMAEPQRWASCQNQLVWPDSLESTEVDPGEAVADAFALSETTHGLQPGTYEGALGFTVTREDSDDPRSCSVDVTLTIEPAREQSPPEYERPLDAAATDAEDFDGRLDADVLEPVSENRPGIVEVAFTSEWDERRAVETLRTFPFGRFVGETDAGDRVVLQPTDVYAPGYLGRDGCWRSTVVPCADESQRMSKYFDPGESVRQRYVVLGHPDDDCPPGGEYAFSARYETDGEDSVTTEKQKADLGFNISLGEVPDGYEAAMTPRESESSDGSGAETPTPTATQSPTDTATTTGTESADTVEPAETTEKTAEPTSTDGATWTEDGGAEQETEVGPEPEDHPGFGVGGAVAGLAGWLAARRFRAER